MNENANANANELRNRRRTRTIAGTETATASVNVVLGKNDDDGVNDIPLTKDNNNSESNNSSSSSLSLPKAIVVLIHIIAICCFIYGFIIRGSKLNTGNEECDMTYSMRISSAATNSYGFYKFVDRRDPRYTKFINTPQKNKPTIDNPVKRNEHCKNNPNIVLYVPGHWGSYDQSRSLGAHGIQLTGANDPNVFAIKKLLSKMNNDNGNSDGNDTDTNTNTSINKFIYDVYAIDFNEQGSALHGFMGGYVIRLMLKNNPEFVVGSGIGSDDGKSESGLSGGHGHGHGINIQNVITLATPHSNPLYSFDKSIYDIHQQILVEQQQQQQPLIISISGGLRDEMIDPSAFSTDLMMKHHHQDKLLLGMDHRAIVWCHQLLQEVRHIIHYLTVVVKSSSTTTNVRLAMVRGYVINNNSMNMNKNNNNNANNSSSSSNHHNDEYSYLQQLKILYETTLNEKYHFFEIICMESSHLYNIPYLLGLYTLLTLIQLAPLSNNNSDNNNNNKETKKRNMNMNMNNRILPVIATILFGISVRGDDISWMSTIILGLVANAVNVCKNRKNDTETETATTIGSSDINNEDISISHSNSPLQTLSKALLRSFIVVLFLGMIITNYYDFFLPHLSEDNNNNNNNSAALLFWWWLWNRFESILYVYVIFSVYVILIVWLGFIDNNNVDDDDNNNGEEDDSNDNNKNNNMPGNTTSSLSSSSFPDIQLIAFIMLIVVPITVCGSMVLMIWEKKVQISSWYTLLSIQIPILILSTIKIGNTTDTNRGAKKMKKKEQQIRSSLTHIMFFSFYHQLLSQGKGYVIPYVTAFILWIDIILSISFMLFCH
ncbi:hypothetical protein FRACYDRAFT_238685 [Fragilariopsis cylindrus CCMP1102]|uniref:GPI inositol-deacylase PGAP1-like alpha/beta domain-containing protein n=1 Tax=Fragilariopsis cylindrus CCMP1102 TaxID=635003 RepID=A0A1E7FD50_9STRA|nr:hypothetical protein FRACYDRAFT_238685 [Fragilariopsis cylindrus CCMP1102]|eukprot:OEU16098.1 hypothetical protein FRACYDRAFT_238685 [Fragilariopsis cylindrus CCMP1102]